MFCRDDNNNVEDSDNKFTSYRTCKSVSFILLCKILTKMTFKENYIKCIYYNLIYNKEHVIYNKITHLVLF